jgi:hypothetical protein
LQFCSGFIAFSDDLNRFLKCFRDIFLKFGYWFKDVQVVRVILSREKQQTSIQTSQNMRKEDI